MRRGLSALAVAALFVAFPARAQYPASSDQAQGQQGEDQKKAKKPRASRNLITREEVEKSVEKGALNAYEVVQQLRRTWFRVRTDLTATTGANTYAPNRPMIFMDMQPMGDDPELLRGVKLDLIKEIRFLSGPDATTLFGTGYPHGVIQLVTQ
jgi:hypothetical protein